MEVQLTFGDGSTEQLETDDVDGLLAAIDSTGWFERAGGRFARVVSVHVFDAEQHAETLRRLSESRAAFGRGFGRSWPPPSGRT